MSDYMFMLESHLSPSQGKALAEVARIAAEANVTLFLTGGAMRDMLGGFPIRDLDFAVEGDAPAVAKILVKKAGARLVASDSVRRSAEIEFPEGVTAEIAMCRRERYAKPGGRPQIQPATIHEDLRRRDFTVNAIALSLNRASRGLLLDPNNGLADLERRELRATNNYVFHDDPARLLRLLRLRVRMGFTVEERTLQQYQNARAEALESRIPAKTLLQELRCIAEELDPAGILAAFSEENLMGLFSPVFAGPKLNLQAVTKLQKARELIPYGVDFRYTSFGLLLYFLTEKFTPKEKSAFTRSLGIGRAEVASWLKLDSKTKKLEKLLKSAKLHRASEVWRTLGKVPAEEVLFLYLHSDERLVHDRIRNYLQKYLLAAQEVTEQEVARAGLEPGTAKYQKLRDEMVAARLDGRVRKKAAPPE